MRPLIGKWEAKLGVRVEDDFLLNTELVKKPRELLDYVIAHEMMGRAEALGQVHHADEQARAGWREARAELNALRW